MTIRFRAVQSVVLALGVVAGSMFAGGSARASSGVPALEVVSPNGGRSVLMGSLHVADPRLRQPDPRALDGFRQLVLEHPAALEPASSAWDATGRPKWAAMLTDDQVAELRRHLHCQAPNLSDPDLDIGMEFILRQPTDVGANQLAYATCDAAGYRSRDEIIKDAAGARHLPTRYLESDQAVAGQRLKASTSDSQRSIAYALSADAAELKAQVVDALNRGDFAAAAAISEESVRRAGGDPRVRDAIMVRERNAQWLKKLPDLLQSGGTFVLVGVAHLPGPDGLVAGLRARGFAIKSIELPAGTGR
ncbi:TraB/GumN family protein [Burkholderia stagnalis]